MVHRDQTTTISTARPIHQPGWAIQCRCHSSVEARVVPLESSVFVHCVLEYKNLDNVHSGECSQEITFDFVSAEAGIYRQTRAIFLKGYHQFAAQGGATLFDHVRVLDLGP